MDADDENDEDMESVGELGYVKDEDAETLLL